MAKKSIIWLASYPKSGNTWLRIFLANYILNPEKPLSINQVHRIGMGDAIAKTYRMVAKGAYNPDDPRQCMALRPAVLSGIVNNDADVNFVKTHNENGVAFGAGLIPPELTRSAIYILRNPLDTILSYASHYGQSVDQAIESASRTDHVLPGHGENAFQFLGNWSNHVQGWTRARKFPVLTIRYEDMQGNPHETFRKAVEFIGLDYDQDRVDKAIGFSSFDELRRQEDAAGFIENSENQDRFFRSGKSGNWKTELSTTQIAQIRKDHGKVMQKYGYL